MIVTPTARPLSRPGASLRGEAKAAGTSTSTSTHAADPEAELTDDQRAMLERQRSAFNLLAAENAELLREANILRDMAIEQRKHDDEFLKKLVSMI